jgi:hypothetical protein
MRLTLQIFATVFLVSLVLGSLLMVQINWDWAAKVTALRGDVVSLFLVESARKDIPEASAFATVAWLWLGLGITTAIGVIAVYWRNHVWGLVIAFGLIAFAVVTVLLQPGIDNIDGNNPKVTGMGIAFFGILGMLIVILLHTMMKTEQAETERKRLY